LEHSFINSIEPNTVICSCGKNAYENEQVIGGNNNFRLHYTGKDGAVTIHADKNGVIQIDNFTKEK